MNPVEACILAALLSPKTHRSTTKNLAGPLMMSIRSKLIQIKLEPAARA